MARTWVNDNDDVRSLPRRPTRLVDILIPIQPVFY